MYDMLATIRSIIILTHTIICNTNSLGSYYMNYTIMKGVNTYQHTGDKIRVEGDIETWGV